MHSSIVEKLMNLVTLISETQKPMTFSELVKKSGLNKSTLHRLLAICAKERLVWFDSHRKVYLLGPRVFDLVRNAFKGYDIQAVALDEMIRLFDMFDANVTIGIPSGLEVVYLRVLESQQSLGSVQQPGTREAVHCSASGKALMAYLPDPLIASKLDGYEFTQFTGRTITNAKDFKTELDFVRVHGFGKNDREEYDHFLGISAPIFNYVGEPIAALNIWSMYPRHKMEDLIGWSGELKNAAARVTSMIGGMAPDTNTLNKS
ncbi:MAG: IclR family transcriptional regulator [Pseudomonadota bacterium]